MAAPKISKKALTNGSRRKLLKHINEGLYLDALTEKMGVGKWKLRLIIQSDSELREACIDNGTMSPSGHFEDLQAQDRHAQIGYNPSFVRKVLAKRRKDAEKQRMINREMAKAGRLEELEKSAQQRLKIEELSNRLFGNADPVDIVIGDKPTVRDIIQSVIIDTEFTYEDIIGQARGRNVTAYRHMAIAKTAELRTDLSTTTIGRLFGGRDHSTIINVIQKMGVNRIPLRHNRPLEDGKIEDFKKLRSAGMGLERIAQKLDVSRTTLRKFEAEQAIAA